MFNKLFGKNTNFTPESESTPLDDAKAICESVDLPVLKAASDEYIRIEKLDDSYDHDWESTYKTTTPTYKALQRLIELNGDFAAFPAAEGNLLHALKDGFVWYDDIIHVLIDHHADSEAGSHIFEAHPELHQYLPEKYDNPKQVLEVVLEIVRDYQWQLEHFAMKHHDAIEIALAKLENREPEIISLDDEEDDATAKLAD